MTFIPSTDFFFDVARGVYGNMTAVRKFGRNDDIDSGTVEDIWAAGGVRAWLSSAETMDIVSDDSDDDGDPAGNGARTLTISGLDASYDEISETVTLNGTSAVTTSNSYLRVFRAFVATAGSNGSNAGAITIDPSSSGSGSRQGSIAEGDGQTLIAHYTIPAGKTAYLVGAQCTIASKDGASGIKECKPRLWIRTLNGAWRRTDGTATSPDLNFTVPQPFEEKTDIKWNARSDTNNSSVYIQYNLVLVDN